MQSPHRTAQRCVRPPLPWQPPMAFVLAFAAAVQPIPAAAEELGLLGGAAHSNETGHHSGAYAFDYQENFGAHLAAGGGYVNEGHATNDHRDGLALQLRARVTVLDPRLTLVAGIGPLFYFNTTRADPR